MELIEKLLELYEESRTCQYAEFQEKIDSELESIKTEMRVIITRYFLLQERYLNQNEKHFGELLSNYFDDSTITSYQKMGC